MEKLKSKLTVIFLILTVGITGAYFIISNISPSQTNLGNKKNLSLNDGVLDENNFAGQNQEIFAESNVNLTEALGQSFFNQVQKADLAGQSQKNPALLSQGVLGDISQSSPKLKTLSDIDDSELNVLSDNSAEAKKRYWEGVENIIDENGDGIDAKMIADAVYDVYGKLNIAPVSKLVDSYKNMSSELVALAVPSSLADIHKQMVVYYQNAEIVFRAMSDYPNDPIKGYLALEMMDALKQEEINLEEILNSI